MATLPEEEFVREICEQIEGLELQLRPLRAKRYSDFKREVENHLPPRPSKARVGESMAEWSRQTYKDEIAQWKRARKGLIEREYTRNMLRMAQLSDAISSCQRQFNSQADSFIIKALESGNQASVAALVRLINRQPSIGGRLVTCLTGGAWVLAEAAARNLDLVRACKAELLKAARRTVPIRTIDLAGYGRAQTGGWPDPRARFPALIALSPLADDSWPVSRAIRKQLSEPFQEEDRPSLVKVIAYIAFRNPHVCKSINRLARRRRYSDARQASQAIMDALMVGGGEKF